MDDATSQPKKTLAPGTPESSTTTAPEVTKTEEPAHPAAVKAKSIVDQFVDGLRNSPVAQHTPSWNFIQKELDKLRDAIEKGFSEL